MAAAFQLDVSGLHTSFHQMALRQCGQSLLLLAAPHLKMRKRRYPHTSKTGLR